MPINPFEKLLSKVRARLPAGDVVQDVEPIQQQKVDAGLAVKLV